MTAVSRWVVVSRAADSEATHTTIECAVRADLTSPAHDMIDALVKGIWAEDPAYLGVPVDDQIHSWAAMLAELEFIADRGRPSRRSIVKHLREGVWEIKHGSYRVTYYDTPGDGSFEPKPWQHDYDPSDPHFYWYPHMDDVLRLANGWPKTGQKAPQDSVRDACVIREEDTAHDR